MRALLTAVAAALVLASSGSAAAQDRGCGTVRRPATDARVAVSVTKGSASCRTARGVLSRYWRAGLAADRTRTVGYRGTRWRCVPEQVMSGARAWGCSTPRQRTLVAGVEVR